MSLLGIEGAVLSPAQPVSPQPVPAQEQTMPLGAVTLPAHFRGVEPLHAPSLPEKYPLAQRFHEDEANKEVDSPGSTEPVPDSEEEVADGEAPPFHFSCHDYYTKVRTGVKVPSIERDSAVVDLVRHARFSGWDPLAHKDKIDVVVLDVGGLDHVCGNDLHDRITFPEGYFEHGQEIGDLIRSAADPEYLNVRVEVVDQTKVSFAHYVSNLNDEIEKSGKRPDMVNLSVGVIVPAEQGVLFTPELRAVAGATPIYSGLDKDIAQIERLARNTDGPVFISAGNSGVGTVNVYRFARGSNIVVVGATDDKGLVAGYSSMGGDVMTNGDLASGALCDEDGHIIGIEVNPGKHHIWFSENLPSYNYVNGHSLEEVRATPAQVRLMGEALRRQAGDILGDDFQEVVFTADDLRVMEKIWSESGLERMRTLLTHALQNPQAFDMSEVQDFLNPPYPNSVDQVPLGGEQDSEVPPVEAHEQVHAEAKEWTLGDRLTQLADFLEKNNAALDARSTFRLAVYAQHGLQGKVLGLYWPTDTGLALSPSCDESGLYFPSGTSYSSPKVGYLFVKNYLSYHGIYHK